MPFEESAYVFGNQEPETVPAHALRFLFVNYLRQEGNASVGPARIFPVLPGGRPNPSSEVGLAPLLNMFSGHRGRPGIFRGHFTTNNGTFTSEMGINVVIQIQQDATDTTDGTPSGAWVDIEIGGADWSDPAMLAAEVLRTLYDAVDATDLVGDFGLGYKDEREDPDAPTFAFWITGTTRFKVRKATVANGWVRDDNLMETLGWEDSASFVNAYEGNAVLHTEEWAIWDTGPDAGLVLGLGLENEAAARGGLARWFAMFDCSFDRMPALKTNGDPLLGSPNIASLLAALGYGKLMLQCSSSLADLENDHLNTAKFVEGVNQWTLVNDRTRASYGGATEYDPVLERAGLCYGTDGYLYPQRAAVNPFAGDEIDTTFRPHFPARRIAAYIGGGAGTPAWNAADVSERRYWRLTIVNRGNLTRKLRLGYCHLDPGFYFTRNPTRDFGRGVADQSINVETDLGGVLAVAREPKTLMAMRWNEGTPFPEVDAWVVEQVLLGQTIVDATWPSTHAIQTSMGTIAGRARPMVIIDPTFFPGSKASARWGRGFTGSPRTFNLRIEDVDESDVYNLQFPSEGSPFVTDNQFATKDDVALEIAALIGTLAIGAYDVGIVGGAIQIQAIDPIGGIGVIVTGSPGTGWPLLGFPADESPTGSPATTLGDSFDLAALNLRLAMFVGGMRTAKWAAGMELGYADVDVPQQLDTDLYEMGLRLLSLPRAR